MYSIRFCRVTVMFAPPGLVAVKWVIGWKASVVGGAGGGATTKRKAAIGRIGSVTVLVTT